MRKILLASAAMLGATSYVVTADAQPTGMSMAPTQGQTMTATAGSPPAGANNNNNSAAATRKGAVAVPEPGTVVIHFNGRVTAALNGVWSSVDTVSAAGGGVAAGAFKQSPIGLQTYGRLYTGLDAMTTNGIRYGGAIEVRNNFPAVTSSSSGTGASGYTSGQTFYLRRAFAYGGTDQAGLLRVGQADGLISLYDNGVTTFQFLPSGNLNGGDLIAGVSPATNVPFANFAVAGNEYGNAKVVYLSPQFAGFDVGFQWAPNTNNANSIGAGGCTTAATGCPSLSSSTVALDGSRILNQTAVGARYQGAFGPVNLLAYGVYMFSGHAKYTGPAITYAAARAANSSAGTGQFEDLSFGSIGAAITVAGVTVGGNWIVGDVNGQGALKPSGGAKMSGVVAGVKYTQGPITVGAVGEMIDSQGAVQLTGVSQRRELGFDAGASYTIAPGLIGWAEYMYQQRHQGGFNFAQGSTSASPGAYNDVKSHGFQVGTTVYW
jgi:hypothetical protein